VEKGVYVTLASGRHYPFTKAVAKDLQLNAPVIAHNGAYVANPYNDHLLMARRIPNSWLLRIVSDLSEMDVSIIIMHEKEAVMNRKLSIKEILGRLKEINSLKYYLSETYPIKHVPSKELHDYLIENRISPPQVLLLGENEVLERIRLGLDQRYAGLVRTTTSGYGLEILPAWQSKARGIELLCLFLGISPRNVMAIGDHYNDLEMIQYAGIGVAMANAPEPVRTHANAVTLSNDEDGVAKAIERWVLYDTFVHRFEIR
jgi:Cof subfamily protein (haloacid dehalogenase superfamily)